MPLVPQDAKLLDDCVLTSGTSGAGHNGWREIEGSTHTAVVTADGGTPTVVIQWSHDGVTVVASDTLSSISGVASVHRAGEVWRFVRASITSNAGADTLNASVNSI